ncbi:MAG: hypothetical protein HN576_01240 [Bacteriovoracaceae bacterium]|nr:hypothetical protein [Bacteriovoracaceae bacterium]
MFKHSKKKVLLFYSIIFSPCILLFIYSVFIIHHFYSFSEINDQEILLDHFESQAHESSERHERHTKLLESISNDSIIIFGGSSVVLPDGCVSSLNDSKTFSVLLKKELIQKNIEVINMGACGFDSFNLLSLTKEILSKKIKPKALIYYTGHNDFSNGGRAIFEEYSPFTQSTVKKTLRMIKIPDDLIFKAIYILGDSITPGILKLYRTFHSNFLDSSQFSLINESISKQLFKNINSIIRLANNNQVKVIIIPAIGNLVYPPHTPLDKTAKSFSQSVRENNISDLQIIADNDNWGFDRRIKSSSYQLFNKLENVLIIDLFNKVRTLKSSLFYKKCFVDIFHLSNYCHQFIKDEILGHIINTPSEFNILHPVSI